MNNNCIFTENLHFSYKKGSKILEDISISVPEGSIYGFLGPNGAGKTTTIRLLLGLLKPGAGRINLLGKYLENHKIEIFSKIGSLIEQPSLYNHLTGKENLEIACTYRNISQKKIPELLQLVKLSNDANKKVKAYSTGMKQRLGLAIALLPEPELIILDEPTNGLDPEGIREVRDIIKDLNKRKNMTVFLSSHLLSEIEKVCTHVGIINSGKVLFQGTIDDLKQTRKGTINLILNTNSPEKTAEILSEFSANIQEQKVIIQIQDKNQVSEIIDHLRNEKVMIYEVRQEIESLEDLFLELVTKK